MPCLWCDSGQGHAGVYGWASRTWRVNKQMPLKATRDKAILLIGFAGTFRRSELVALNTAAIVLSNTAYLERTVSASRANPA